VDRAQREYNVKAPEWFDLHMGATAVAEAADRVLCGQQVEIGVQFADLAGYELLAGIAWCQPVPDGDDVGRSIKEAVPDVFALADRSLLLAEHLREIGKGAALLVAMRERDEIKRSNPDQQRDREHGQAAEEFGADDCDDGFAR